MGGGDVYHLDVFVSEQWGGWAYKIPGPNGNRAKPKLVAFVHEIERGRALCVEFKLQISRADQSITEHDWIDRHPWQNLGPAGWVQAQLTRKPQVPMLSKLITESRALLPKVRVPETQEVVTDGSRTARHIDHVMRAARDSGWCPTAADDFEE